MPRFAVAPVQQGTANWAAARTVVPPPLTPVQVAIIKFVHWYQQMWGATPLYREIGQACGLASDSAVAYQIRRLVTLGLVRKPARLHRAMHLTVVPVPQAA